VKTSTFYEHERTDLGIFSSLTDKV